MSGGAYEYGYDSLYNYEGHMKDEKLNELLKDFTELLHDLEWCDSGDTNEFDYADSVNHFKQKWLEDKEKFLPTIDFTYNYHYEDIIKEVLEKRSNDKVFYVLHYDYETGDYLSDFEFMKYKDALFAFEKAKPLGIHDRIELMFAPELEDSEYQDNMIIKYKVDLEKGAL